MRKLAVAFLLIISLSGCSQKPESFDSLIELRDAFVKAGGQCWEWETTDPKELGVLTQKEHGECDSKTVLVLFEDGISAENEALTFARAMRGLNFKVKVLFGENWMINSDQVKSVHSKLGGTLVTR